MSGGGAAGRRRGGGGGGGGVSPEPGPELERWREPQESERRWALRREFLLRNREGRRGEAAFRGLLALSQAWANHRDMGCRYGPQVMEKVLQMAEGIDVGETTTSFELVLPGSSAKKRPRSPSQEAPSRSLEAPKKQAPKFRARPRFEPIHFVASKAQDKGKDKPSENQTQADRKTVTTQQIQNYSDQVFSSFNNQDGDCLFSRSLGLGFGGSQPEAKAVSKNKDASVAGGAADGPSALQSTSETFPKTVITAKQYFMDKLVAAVRKNLTSPEDGGGPDKINYTFLLTRSIQACKTNPEYIYSSLKDLVPADLSKSKKPFKEGFACEVRCQNVYLATGYAGSKNGSRDRATELAVLLLQKPVEVQVARRKFKDSVTTSTMREDLVLCERGKAPFEFPSSLKQLDNVLTAMKKVAPEELNSDPQQGPSSGKHWTDFVLTKNASDAIGILNNSACHNRMLVEYKYALMLNHLWRCSVYLENHLLAEGYGTKKTSKHAAAEKALEILQKTESNAGANKAAQVQKANAGAATWRPAKKSLKDLVLYENSMNPVSTLNDTAQFNKMTVEYVFEMVTGMQWKCKVMLDNELIAEAVGVKKIVKNMAAEEAVKILKKTQPTVVNNLKRGTAEDVISRNEIRGHSAVEALNQQIKEDNIGNQILRKMGWTGGGLGKSGEGIREPIAVKEQFKREGLGLEREVPKIARKDIEQIIQKYAFSDSEMDLTFSTELTNEERKQIHQIAQRYGLRSRSYGQGRKRHLVVSRKRRKEELLHQLKQDGQVGYYELIMPQDK